MKRKKRKKRLNLSTPKNLKAAIEIVGLTNSRTRFIIESRVERQNTLEEIGKELGITRERVRQIIDRVTKKFLEHRVFFAPYLNAIETFVSTASPTYIEKVVKNRQDAERWILDLLHGQNFEVSSQEVAQLVLLTRSIVKKERGIKSLRNWPKFTYLACKISPIVLEHPTIQQAVAEKKKRARNSSYKELAVLILKEVGHPLHWRKIVEYAYQLHKRENFNAAAMYNALQTNKEIFVLTATGTYGLTEWNLKRPRPYPDIIAEVLREEGQNLSLEAIYSRVKQIRPIKRSSLQWFLTTHPRFYKAINATYGLRAWLPPREEQTLRTPEWLIEDKKSYKRVDSARKRGYDIESMIQRDRDLLER